MSFSTYLTEKVTGMAKDKVDEFFEKIKEKVEYEKLVKSIEVTIEEECIRMDEVNFNGYSDRIKQIIRNYNYIDKILHYWTGIEFDYRCSKEMIDALTANIAGFDNLTVLNASPCLIKLAAKSVAGLRINVMNKSRCVFLSRNVLMCILNETMKMNIM